MSDKHIKVLMWICIVGSAILGASALYERNYWMLPANALSLFFSVATIRNINKRSRR